MIVSSVSQSSEGGNERIAKVLARAGVGSRREVEKLISEGRVSRGGAVVTTPATLINSTEGIKVDGKPVGAPERTRLFLFHKPRGVLTASKDPQGRPTINDAIPQETLASLPRLFPIGRLDMATEGLLLLTNDGELKRTMELPANAFLRCYRARVQGTVQVNELDSLKQGINIDGIDYGSISVEVETDLERSESRNTWLKVTLSEGKNREVRKVLDHLGLEVNRLVRKKYGPFKLGKLEVSSIMEVPNSVLKQFMHTLTDL